MGNGSNRASNWIALTALVISGVGLIYSIRNDKRVDRFEYNNAAAMYSPRLNLVEPIMPKLLIIDSNFQRRVEYSSADYLDATLHCQASIRNDSEFVVRVLGTLATDAAFNPDIIRDVMAGLQNSSKSLPISTAAQMPTSYCELQPGDTYTVDYSALLHFESLRVRRPVHFFTFYENPQKILYDVCASYWLDDNGMFDESELWVLKYKMPPNDDTPIYFKWIALEYLGLTSHYYSQSEGSAVLSRIGIGDDPVLRSLGQALDEYGLDVIPSNP